MSEASHIIGKSEHAGKLRRLLTKLRRDRRHCLVIGETGVGKTAFATELGRTDTTFAVIDVAQRTEEELAHLLSEISGGTILLERIDRSGFRSQKVLLEFLARSGKTVRILASLTEDPAELQKRGALLEELYATLLGFVSVEILPLRERPEDIPLLVRHFAPDLTIDINGLEALVRRTWRGNISELRDLVGLCIERSHDGRLQLPAEVVEEQPEIVRAVSGILRGHEQELTASLDGMERGILARALDRFGSDLAGAAGFLGMSMQELEGKARRLGLLTARSR